MPNRHIRSIGALIAAFLLLTSCRAERIHPPESRVKMLNEWLDTSPHTPADRVREEFEPGQSVILVQDKILRADTINLVQALLPLLYDLGIRTMGLYHFDITSQGNLDRYSQEVNSNPAQLEELAASMAFLGYVEYRNFLEYIRGFNGQLNPGEEVMRTVALGESGAISPAKAEKLLDEGSNFLWLRPKDLELIRKSPRSEEVPRPEPLILTHYGPGPSGLQLEGVIEYVKAQRPMRDRTFAFHPDTPPFLLWHYKDAVEPDIVIVTAFPYRAITAIPNFITPKTFEEALGFFPEIQLRRPQNLPLPRMNRIIGRQAKQYALFLKRLELPPKGH